MTEIERWQQANNVLCVRLDTIGDVLMTSPAIRALSEGAPRRRVTLLTSRSGAEAAALLPEVDEALLYEAPWMKATPPRGDAGIDRDMIECLMRRRFDAAVIFTSYSQSALPAALLCTLAGVPLRLAYCRENPYQLLTTWAPELGADDGSRHEVQRQLDLVAAAGCRPRDERLRIKIPERARAEARAALRRAGVDAARPFVLVHPGATVPSRRYRADGFARAADIIAARSGMPIVLSGGEPERDLVADVAAAMRRPASSVAGSLDLAALAALIEMAGVIVTNNTGPAHIAAATGTPSVVLYALTNPQHAPWRSPSRLLYRDVPCRWCYKSVCPEGHHDCIDAVPPEEVAEAACDLLEVAERKEAIA